MEWLSFVIILIVTAIYCLVHSWLAANQTKDWTARHWPKFHAHFYRLFFNFFGVVSLLPVLYLIWKMRSITLYTIPTPVVYITILIQLAASIAIVLVVGDTGGLSFIGVTQLFRGQDSGHKLVTRGIYRLIRHPLYTLGLIILWLIPKMNTNILALNIALSLYIYFGARLEEAKLRLEYPDYEAYQKQVPMLFPRFK